MSWVKKLAAVFRKRQLDEDLGEELGAHVDMLTEDNIALGMEPAEARRQARIKVGNLGVAHELHRDARGIPGLESVLQDLKYGVRTLRRDYGFTLVAVLILGLGIGANATVFSLVNALLLQPLPFADSDRLVWIANGEPGDTNPSKIASRVAIYEQWLEFNTSFEDLAAYNPFFVRGSYSLTGSGEPQRLMGVRVTGNFFPLLGLEPELGRFFTEEETLAEGPPAVILSHGLWQRSFASDPRIIGSSVELNDTSVTVVGVMPASFDFGSVFTPGLNVEIFVPGVLSVMTNWGNTIAVVGRLRPGVTMDAAQAEFNAINERLLVEREDLGVSYTAWLSPLQGHVNQSVRNALFVLWAAVGMVLLIVCANLSNLLLVRGVARRKELAVRAALGAGTGRLVRQLLTETLLLATLGVVLGLGSAALAIRFITSSQAVIMPLLERVQLDAVAVGFTMLVTVAVVLIVGIAPALQMSRRDPFEAMNPSSRGAIGDPMHSLARSSLVVAEVALACVLLVGAGLLVRSFVQILDVDLGFRPAHTASVRVTAGARYESSEALDAFYRQLTEAARAVPGVEAVALTDALPLDSNRSWAIWPSGEEPTSENGHGAFIRLVGDGYFTAMGVPVLGGREFVGDDAADSERVIIINRTLADEMFPDGNAIGALVDTFDRVPHRIIGVVGDVRHNNLDEGSGNEMYLVLPQRNSSSVNLVVRAEGDPLALAGQLRTAMREVDSLLPFTEYRPLSDLVDRALSSRRFFMAMLAGFSGIALILASLGIYGIISYSVGQRRSEIGVRLALGARPAAVLRQEMWRGLAMTLVGLGIGLLGSILLSRLMGSLLFGVGTGDPLAYAATTVGLLAVALLAGYLPARRAANTDPVRALRDA